jgi:nitrous oxide reductase
VGFGLEGSKILAAAAFVAVAVAVGAGGRVVKRVAPAWAMMARERVSCVWVQELEEETY